VLLAGAGQIQLEQLLRRIGVPPEACLLGRAVLDDVLPDFLPRDEALPDNADIADRITAACLLARRFDGEPAVLVSGGTRADLERVLRALGYPPHTYAIAGARLSEYVLVDDWDQVHQRRFADSGHP
jgi:hypothetical protein